MVKIKNFNERLVNYLIEKEKENEDLFNEKMVDVSKNENIIQENDIKQVTNTPVRSISTRTTYQRRSRYGYQPKLSNLRYSFTPETINMETSKATPKVETTAMVVVKKNKPSTKGFLTALTKKLLPNKLNHSISRKGSILKHSKSIKGKHHHSTSNKTSKISKTSNKINNISKFNIVNNFSDVVDIKNIPMKVIESIYTSSFSKHSYYIQRSLRKSTIIVNVITSMRSSYENLREINTPKLKRRISFRKRTPSTKLSIKRKDQPKEGSLIQLREERKAKYYKIFGNTPTYYSPMQTPAQTQYLTQTHKRNKKKIPKKPLLDFSDCDSLPTIPSSAAGSKVNNYLSNQKESERKKLKPIKSIDKELCLIFNKEYIPEEQIARRETSTNASEDSNSSSSDEDDNIVIGKIQLNKNHSIEKVRKHIQDQTAQRLLGNSNVHNRMPMYAEPSGVDFNAFPFAPMNMPMPAYNNMGYVSPNYSPNMSYVPVNMTANKSNMGNRMPMIIPMSIPIISSPTDLPAVISTAEKYEDSEVESDTEEDYESETESDEEEESEDELEEEEEEEEVIVKEEGDDNDNKDKLVSDSDEELDDKKVVYKIEETVIEEYEEHIVYEIEETIIEEYESESESEDETVVGEGSSKITTTLPKDESKMKEEESCETKEAPKVEIKIVDEKSKVSDDIPSPSSLTTEIYIPSVEEKERKRISGSTIYNEEMDVKHPGNISNESNLSDITLKEEEEEMVTSNDSSFIVVDEHHSSDMKFHLEEIKGNESSTLFTTHVDGEDEEDEEDDVDDITNQSFLLDIDDYRTTTQNNKSRIDNKNVHEDSFSFSKSFLLVDDNKQNVMSECMSNFLLKNAKISTSMSSSEDELFNNSMSILNNSIINEPFNLALNNFGEDNNNKNKISVVNTTRCLDTINLLKKEEKPLNRIDSGVDLNNMNPINYVMERKCQVN